MLRTRAVLLKNPFDEKEQGNRVKAVVDLYLQGVALPEIARRTGVSYIYVTKLVKAGEDNAEAACEMYEDGLSISQIAQRLSLPIAEVFKFLKSEFKVAPKEIAGELARLYRSGLSVHEIRALTTIRAETVLDIVRKYGTEIRPDATERDQTVDVPVADMAADYESGLSLRQLEKKYGLAQAAIHQRLKAAGVVLRENKSPRGDQKLHEQIVELWKAGKSMNAISRELGVGDGKVKRVLQARGTLERPVEES